MTSPRLPERRSPLFQCADHPEAWTEAVDCTTLLVRRHCHALYATARLAEVILGHLRIIDPILDSLCNNTCPACKDPCCARALIAFDHADVVFFLLSGQNVPSVQPRPRPEPGVACAYLGPRGCRLPRHRRPWICTWYLCPDQKALTRRMSQRSLAPRLDAIKAARKKMEVEFIAVVAGVG